MSLTLTDIVFCFPSFSLALACFMHLSNWKRTAASIQLKSQWYIGLRWWIDLWAFLKCTMRLLSPFHLHFGRPPRRATLQFRIIVKKERDRKRERKNAKLWNLFTVFGSSGLQCDITRRMSLSSANWLTGDVRQPKCQENAYKNHRCYSTRMKHNFFFFDVVRQQWQIRWIERSSLPPSSSAIDQSKVFVLLWLYNARMEKKIARSNDLICPESHFRLDTQSVWCNFCNRRITLCLMPAKWAAHNQS